VCSSDLGSGGAAMLQGRMAYIRSFKFFDVTIDITSLS
jgi:hypothetical protein